MESEGLCLTGQFQTGARRERGVNFLRPIHQVGEIRSIPNLLIAVSDGNLISIHAGDGKSPHGLIPVRHGVHEQQQFGVRALDKRKDRAIEIIGVRFRPRETINRLRQSPDNVRTFVPSRSAAR